MESLLIYPLPQLDFPFTNLFPFQNFPFCLIKGFVWLSATHGRSRWRGLTKYTAQNLKIGIKAIRFLFRRNKSRSFSFSSKSNVAEVIQIKKQLACKIFGRTDSCENIRNTIRVKFSSIFCQVFFSSNSPFFLTILLLSDSYPVNKYEERENSKWRPIFRYHPLWSRTVLECFLYFRE